MAIAQVAGLKPVEIVAGDIELRLAESEEEIRAAQALRYRIFYEEMAAQPTAEMSQARRDFDSFDEYCDHLLVIDRSLPAGPGRVVGGEEEEDLGLERVGVLELVDEDVPEAALQLLA